MPAQDSMTVISDFNHGHHSIMQIGCTFIFSNGVCLLYMGMTAHHDMLLPSVAYKLCGATLFSKLPSAQAMPSQLKRNLSAREPRRR